MKPLLPALLLTTVLTPVSADETRALDAHVHGVGELNIAFDGNQIALELFAPGADIVGFEYEAKSAEDFAAIAGAMDTLSAPLKLFGLPEAAGCSVTEVKVELVDEHGHDEHGHDAHGHDDHGHDDHDDDHAEHGHDEHGEEHAEKDHDHDHDHDADHADKDHDHDHGEDHAHDDHGHDDHAHSDTEEAGHTEFQAAYLLTCDDASAVTSIAFGYFDAFENALELEVQAVTASGAQGFEVEREDPQLDLGSLF